MSGTINMNYYEANIGQFAADSFFVRLDENNSLSNKGKKKRGCFRFCFIWNWILKFEII